MSEHPTAFAGWMGGLKADKMQYGQPKLLVVTDKQCNRLSE